VGFFGPLKAAWKKQLQLYSDRDPSAKLLAKSEFPRMIKEVLESLKPQELLSKALVSQKFFLAKIDILLYEKVLKLYREIMYNCENSVKRLLRNVS
jgi:hypothetical protein